MLKLTDTHLHLLAPDRFTYAWCKGLPALEKTFSIKDAADAANQAKGGAVIAKSIFMEVDVGEHQQLAEAAHFGAQADDPANTLEGVIASGRPESAGFGDHLEKLLENPHVRGIRRILHTSPDSVSDTALFCDHLRLLPRFGYSFDLCVLERQLAIAARLADQCPQTQFILDHCGNPNVAAGAIGPWRTALLEVAKRPNIVCKISGITVTADPQKPLAAQLRPYVEHSIGAFGWDRVVWGSDFPVCNLTFNLAAWLDATSEILAGESAANVEKLASGNAKRIYGV